MDSLPDPVPQAAPFTEGEITGQTTRVPSNDETVVASSQSSSSSPSRPTQHKRQFSVENAALDQPGLEDLKRRLTKRLTEINRAEGQNVTDPKGEDFNFEAFIRDMLAASTEEGHDMRELGVVVKDLSVQGSAVAVKYGSTVGDILRAPLTLLDKIKAARHKQSKDIISGFTLAVRPGEMLLVLGRPGSGCSTTLKTLANYTESFDSVHGERDYDGISPAEMEKHYSGELSYLPEDDIHFPLLTVKETLEFALSTRGPAKHARVRGMSRKEYTELMLDVLLTLFGLRHVKDTKVGNDFVRGVSGGERKRVSICEALTTRSRLMAHDNSTRGLDASTSLEYIQTLRTATDLLRLTTIASIYQAGEQLYRQFDKVCLIMEGKMIYHGPTTKAAEYFNNLGYMAHDRQTTSDFLVSITDVRARVFADGMERNAPKTAQELADAYVKSDIARLEYEQVDRLLGTTHKDQHDKFKALAREEKARRASPKSSYNISYYQQVRIAMLRRIRLLKGDALTVGIQTGVTIFQALIIGSVFYNIPNNTGGFFSRGGVIFFAILFNSLTGLAEVPAQYAQRPIVVRQRRYAMAKPSADALAQTLIDWMPKFLTILCFDIILYWLSGLAPTASQFFIFLLITLIASLSIVTYFRMLASITRAEPIATLLGGVSVLVFVITVGYAIPRPQMLGWYRWYSISLNPLAFAFEALLANEMNGKNVPCAVPIPSGQGYDVPVQNQACGIPGYNYNTGLVNGLTYIGADYDYSYSHVWRNLGIVIGFWMFFLIIQLIAADRQPDVAAEASVALFRRSAATKHLKEDAITGAAPESNAEKGKTKDTARFQAEENAKMDKAAEAILAKPKDVFTFRHVNYDISVKGGNRRLLNDVSGYVQPGKMTALMGESGAGKTTLLNTLAQRTSSGVVTGDMMVSGRALSNAFQRQTGYVMQQDVHLQTATVREALTFSALLRQPSTVPKQEKLDYVEEIIKLLEMEDFAEALIGEPGQGLGVEQRKKVTIGVELASKPSLLLFLDEPTSGLDSQSAFAIVRLLKKLAGHGQAILCTVHQPSGELFTQFDRLLLLQKGGKTVYFGDLGKSCRTLLDYFEQYTKKPCPEDANPAEWMLEQIGAGATAKTDKDWHALWIESKNAKSIQQEVDDLNAEYSKKSNSSEEDLLAKRYYAASFYTQLSLSLQRAFQSYWRDTTYILGKSMLNIFSGLLVGFTFFKAPTTSAGLQVRLFAVFMSLVVSNPLAQSIMPITLKYRAIYEVREKPSRMYSWLVTCLTPVIVEMPWSIIGATLYFVCWQCVAYSTLLTGYLYGVYLLFTLYYATFAQALASIAPNAQIASLLFATLFSFVIIFCGVTQPISLMPTFWRVWMPHLATFTYIVEALLSTGLGGVAITCVESSFAIVQPTNGQTCAAYLDPFISRSGGYVDNGAATGDCRYCQYATGDEYLTSVQYSFSHRARDVGIIIGYIAFNFALIISLYWLFQVRGKDFQSQKGQKGSSQSGKPEQVKGAQSGNTAEKIAPTIQGSKQEPTQSPA